MVMTSHRFGSSADTDDEMGKRPGFEPWTRPAQFLAPSHDCPDQEITSQSQQRLSHQEFEPEPLIEPEPLVEPEPLPEIEPLPEPEVEPPPEVEPLEPTSASSVVITASLFTSA